MSKKWTARLSLLTIAFVIMIAFVLAWASAPAVVSANAITIVGGEYDDFVWQTDSVTYNNDTVDTVYTKVWYGMDAYDFDADTPIEIAPGTDPTSSVSFEIYDSSLSSELTTMEGDVSLYIVPVTDYSTYGEPLDAAPTEAGLYAVALAVGTYGNEDFCAFCRILVNVVVEYGPVTVCRSNYTWSELLDSHMLLGFMYGKVYGTWNEGTDTFAKYDKAGYKDLGGTLTATLYEYDEEAGDHKGAKIDSTSDGSAFDEDEIDLVAGKYVVDLAWTAAGRYGADADCFVFEIKKLEKSNLWIANPFRTDWGINMMTTLDVIGTSESNVDFGWYYLDLESVEHQITSCTPVGTYEVYGKLTGSDADNCTLALAQGGGVTVIDAEHPVTLTINSCTVSKGYTDADFADGVYKDSWDFLDTSWFESYVGYSADAYLEWHYLDGENKEQMLDSQTDVGTYAIFPVVVGKEKDNVVLNLKLNSATIDAEHPVDFTVTPKIVDVKVYFGGTNGKGGTQIYTFNKYQAETTNYLYFDHRGFTLYAASDEAPEAEFTIDGWKEDPTDENEEAVFTIGNVVCKTYTSIGISSVSPNYAVKGAYTQIIDMDATAVAGEKYYSWELNRCFYDAGVSHDDPVYGLYTYDEPMDTYTQITEPAAVAEWDVTYYDKDILLGYREISMPEGGNVYEWYRYGLPVCIVKVDYRDFSITGLDAEYTGEAVKPSFEYDANTNPGETFNLDKSELFTDSGMNNTLVTEVGEEGHYGIQFIDTINPGTGYRINTDYTSCSWDYHVIKASATINIDEKEPWYYKERVSKLKNKLGIVVMTNDPEDFPDDQVEIDDIEWKHHFYDDMHGGADEWISFENDRYPTADELPDVGENLEIRVTTTQSASTNYDATTRIYCIEIQKAPVYIRTVADLTYNGEGQKPGEDSYNYYVYSADGSRWTDLPESELYVKIEDDSVFEEGVEYYEELAMGGYERYWDAENMLGSPAYGKYLLTHKDLVVNAYGATQVYTNAGTYALQGQLNPAYGYSARYELIFDEDATYQIKKATLGATLADTNGTYGDVISVSDLVLSGYFEGEAPDYTSYQLYYSPKDADLDAGSGEWINISEVAFDQFSDVGAYQYKIVCTYANYNDIVKIATYTVEPKELNVTWNLSGDTTVTGIEFDAAAQAYWDAGHQDEGDYYLVTNYVYTGVELHPTWTLTGIVNNDDVSVDHYAHAKYTGSSWGAVDYGVGKHQIILQTLKGEKASNYVFCNQLYRYCYYGITPATLTVTADDKEVTYGSATPDLTYEITGFVAEESEVGLRGSGFMSGLPSVSCEREAYSNVGDYDIVAAVGTLTAENYIFVVAKGTLAVGKATLTVTADNQTVTYGDFPPAYTATITGFLGTDTVAVVTGSATVNCGYSLYANAHGYTIYASEGTLSATNYSFIFETGNLTVNKANLTVAAVDKEVTYGSETPDLTYEITGFLGSDSIALVEGAPELSCARELYDNVGGYPITTAVGTLSALNYNFIPVDGMLTVIKAALTITPDGGKTKAYGASDPVFTYKVTGELNGEKTVLTGALSRESGEVVGDYNITIGTLDLTDDDVNGNYEINFVEGIKFAVGKESYDIGKVSFFSDYNPYTGLNKTLQITVDGELPAWLSVEYYLTDSEHTATDTVFTGRTNYGTYYVEARFSVTDEDSYVTPSSMYAVLDIQKREVSVQWTTAVGGYFYSGSNQNFPTASASYTIQGVGIEPVVLTVTERNSKDFKAVGSYTFDAVSTDDNYVVSEESSWISVQMQKKYLTITWTSSRVYTGETLAPIPTVEGYVDGEEVSAAILNSNGMINVNTWNTIRFNLTGADKDNYQVESDYINGNGNYAIIQKELTVTWNGNGETHKWTPNGKPQVDAFSFEYNGQMQKPAAQLVGVIGDDLAYVEIVWSQYSEARYVRTDGGHQHAVISGLDGDKAGNYKFAENAELDKYFNIYAKDITVSWGNTTFTYGNAARKPSVSFPGGTFFSDDAQYITLADYGDTDGAKIDANTPANPTYTATVVYGGDRSVNYNITNKTTTFVINPVALTLTIDNKTSVYGDALKAFSVTPVGYYYDQISEIFTFSCLDGENQISTTSGVGVYDITLVYGSRAFNYDITVTNEEAKGAYEITKKEVTVTYTSDKKVVTYGNLIAWNALGTEMFDNDYYLDIPVFERDSDDVEIIFNLKDEKGDFIDFDEPPQVGTYTMDVEVNHANYTFTIDLDEAVACLEVEKATITVTPDAEQSKIYGEADGALTYKFFIDDYDWDEELDDYACTSTDDWSDIIDLFTVGALARAAGENVGTYAINMGTIAFMDAAKVDEAFVEYAKSTSDEDDDDEYTVEALLEMLTLLTRNYEFDLSDENYTIAKKVITVTADNKESNYEDALVELSFTGAIEEGDVVCTIATTADKTKAGTYPITLTSTNNPNYVVTLVPGTYTVKAKAEVDENGNVEKTEDIKDEIKQATDGVSIKNMIQNVIEFAADAPATLKIEVTDAATVAFDKAALKKLAESADVKISYKETKKADVDTSKKEFKNAQLVIEVSLAGQAFDGGKATITTAFENKAPGGKKAVLYFVDENGKKTDMKATFADGKVTFTTGHFSTYIVEYKLTGGSIAGIIIACVVAAAGIAVLVFFLLKKKGGKGGAAE